MLVQVLTIVQIAAAAVFVVAGVLLWRATGRAAAPPATSASRRGDAFGSDLVAAAVSAVTVLAVGLGRVALSDASARGPAWELSFLPGEAAWAVTIGVWLAVAASGLLAVTAVRRRAAERGPDREPSSGGAARQRSVRAARAPIGVGVVAGLLALAEAVVFATQASGSSLPRAADVLTHELGKSAAGIFPVVLFPFFLLTLLLVLAVALRSLAPSDGAARRLRALPLGLLAAVAVLVVLTDLVVAYLLTRGALDLTAGGGAEITIWVAYLLLSLGLLALLLYWAVRRRPVPPVALPAEAGVVAGGKERRDAQAGTLVVDAAGDRPPARSLAAASPLLTVAGVLALLAVLALLVAPLLPYWQGVAVAWAGVACGLACLPVGAVVFFREVLKG